MGLTDDRSSAQGMLQENPETLMLPVPEQRFQSLGQKPPISGMQLRQEETSWQPPANGE